MPQQSTPDDQAAQSTPLVSVLIPAYNAASTLQETLDSMLAQTYPHWEAVVIDDGSTDGTVDLLAAQTDPRIRFISQPNGGLASARNAGCEAARGELLAILDADDLATPDRLALQVSYLQSHPGVDWCCSNFTAFNELGELPPDFVENYYPILKQSPDGWRGVLGHEELWQATPGLSLRVFSGSGYEWLAHGSFVHPPTLMFRRGLWQDVGRFDPAMRTLTDWDWIVRAARRGRLAYLDRPLLRYRRHAQQATGPLHALKIARDVITVCEKIRAQDPELSRRDQAWFDRDLCGFHQTMASVLANTDGLAALGSLRQALRLGPVSGKAQAFILGKALTPRFVIDSAKGLRKLLRGPVKDHAS